MAVHHVLNECLVDRGASPAMVTLQVSADRHHITTVQVIISTTIVIMRLTQWAWPRRRPGGGGGYGGAEDSSHFPLERVGMSKIICCAHSAVQSIPFWRLRISSLSNVTSVS